VEYIPTPAPRTQTDYRRHVVRLKVEFGSRLARELKPKDFGPFLDVKRARMERNRCVAVMSCAFSEAVSGWYWLDYNVLRDVKRNPSSPRTCYVTDAEFESCKAMARRRVTRLPTAQAIPYGAALHA
jgi:hypothetical protein